MATCTPCHQPAVLDAAARSSLARTACDSTTEAWGGSRVPPHVGPVRPLQPLPILQHPMGPGCNLPHQHCSSHSSSRRKRRRRRHHPAPAQQHTVGCALLSHPRPRSPAGGGARTCMHGVKSGESKLLARQARAHSSLALACITVLALPEAACARAGGRGRACHVSPVQQQCCKHAIVASSTVSSRSRLLLLQALAGRGPGLQVSEPCGTGQPVPGASSPASPSLGPREVRVGLGGRRSSWLKPRWNFRGGGGGL